MEICCARASQRSWRFRGVWGSCIGGAILAAVLAGAAGGCSSTGAEGVSAEGEVSSTVAVTHLSASGEGGGVSESAPVPVGVPVSGGSSSTTASLSASAGGVDQGPSPEGSVSPTAAPAVRVAIDTIPERRAGGSHALLRGTLRADQDGGCVYFEGSDGQRYHVRWPFGFTFDADGRSVVAEDGSIFTRVDQPSDYNGSTASAIPVPPGMNPCGAETSIEVWK